MDLIKKMLVVNPENRISAEEALKHPWFNKKESPPVDLEFASKIVSGFKPVTVFFTELDIL